MLSFLETVAPYNTLDEQGLQSLANIAIRRNYKKNMVIIQQGDDTNSMFILIEGEMRVYVEDEEGKQLTVRILNPGHSFGEVALIGDFPRTASVMTLTDSVGA
jgi:CRP/FNR family cyclic AMP-dependent transcriptional regulator